MGSSLIQTITATDVFDVLIFSHKFFIRTKNEENHFELVQKKKKLALDLFVYLFIIHEEESWVKDYCGILKICLL